MKIYVKYILNNYLNSLLFVILIMSCLVFILNLLSELDFFKNEDVSVNFSIFLSLLNTPSFGILFPNTLLYIYFAFPIKAKYFIIIYAVIELYLAILNNPNDNVAHFAHLGGMIFGYVIFEVLAKK